MLTKLKRGLKLLKTKLKSRLSQKVILCIFGAILVIEGLIFFPSVQWREQELLSHLKEVSAGKIMGILTTYPNISEAEFIDCLSFLKLSDSYIRGGLVYLSSGQLVGTFGELPQLSISQVDDYRPKLNGSFYDDVVWSGTRMMTKYTIIVRHDASNVRAKLIDYVIKILGLVVLMSLFLTVIVWIALEPLVIMPILRLRHDLLIAGEAILRDQKPLDFYSASSQPQDELGDVISAFNRMFCQITKAVSDRKQAEASLKLSLEREEISSQALNRELKKGHSMQRNFLPRELLQKPGWEIAAFMSPACHVAGDFYDVFELPNNNVALVIADVCGKGVAAALYMGLFRSLIRIFSGQKCLEKTSYISGKKSYYLPKVADSLADNNPLKAVSLTNDYMTKNHGEQFIFATIFFGVLNIEIGRLNYINGGHEPVLIIDSEGNIKESLESTGTVVGILTDANFKIEHTYLNSGDILFGYTDGVTEARASNGKFFNRERLLEVVNNSFTSAEEILETVKAKVLAHIGEAGQFDDITLLAVKRK
ncbi:MAG: PP2C family protein-serine/threonine phosphatase [Xenococcaceae cyanobacterium MO_167.B27]|nr:PP2C family protein-serine/threonine phosphatase [Xenococcaceae cyanobacterium MO_167.B27]